MSKASPPPHHEFRGRLSVVQVCYLAKTDSISGRHSIPHSLLHTYHDDSKHRLRILSCPQSSDEEEKMREHEDHRKYANDRQQSTVRVCGRAFLR